ncbi:MAG: 16S rRNA (guanine(527)-N(7))-methyltransferase RsmG [Desulfobacterales bacterium]
MELGSEAWRRSIREGASLWGLAVDERMLERFARHAEEMLRWNAVTNLTTITEPSAVARDHFLDSLAAAPWVPPGSRLLDVGSGAGFPGVPLHVALAGLETVLLEASRKKVSFLRHLLRTLALPRIRAEQERLEPFAAREENRGSFDVVICRAFTRLDRFVPEAIRLVGAGGRLLALKGPGAGEEIARLERELKKTSGGGLWRVERHPYRLPGMRAERAVCVVSRPIPLPEQPHPQSGR